MAENREFRVSVWQPGDVQPQGRTERWNAYKVLLANGKSLSEQSILVQANGNPEYNYWFIKEILTTPRLTQEQKKVLAMPHVQLVFEGENLEIFEKLAIYLQFKPAWEITVKQARKKT